jgi:hypothetical protein
VREIRRLPKSKSRDGTAGECRRDEPLDPDSPCKLFLPDGVTKELDSSDLLALVAHECGHAATRQEDLDRRRAPEDEWSSEAAAAWYVYRWGFGAARRRYLRRHPEDRMHHGPDRGGWVEIYGRRYSVSRRFVYSDVGPASADQDRPGN